MWIACDYARGKAPGVGLANTIAEPWPKDLTVKLVPARQANFCFSSHLWSLQRCQMHYKFLDSVHMPKVMVDGTIIVSSFDYFRRLEASAWDAIADIRLNKTFGAR